MIRLLFVTTALLSSLTIQRAYANSYSCRSYEYNVSRASSQVSRAEYNVVRAQDAFYRTQDLVNRRLGMYQYQIDSARYNLSRVKSLSAGFTTRCVVRTLFWRGGSCIGSAIYGARNRRVQAQYRVDLAVSRYNSYATYSQGYLYRSAQRVTQAQEQVGIAQARLDDAEDQLRECEAASA